MSGSNMGTFGAAARGVKEGVRRNLTNKNLDLRNQGREQQMEATDLEEERRTKQYEAKEYFKQHMTGRVGQISIDDLVLKPVEPAQAGGMPVEGEVLLEGAAAGPQQSPVQAQPQPQPQGMPSQAPQQVPMGAPAQQVPQQTPMGATAQEDFMPEPQIVELATARRAAHKAWVKEGKNAAMLAGGMQGLKDFEMAELRTMMMETQGYTSGAIMALNRGDSAKGALLMNLALAHQDQDMGYEFVDNGDGTLSAVDHEGNGSGEPWNAVQVARFQEENLKTVDNYADFSKFQQDMTSATLEDENKVADTDLKISQGAYYDAGAASGGAGSTSNRNYPVEQAIKAEAVAIEGINARNLDAANASGNADTWSPQHASLFSEYVKTILDTVERNEGYRPTVQDVENDAYNMTIEQLGN